MRRGRQRAGIAWGAAAALTILGGAFLLRPTRDRMTCGAGFVVHEARCLPEEGCPWPLVEAGESCSARQRVAVPRTEITVGPSDWEAEGKVRPRVLVAGPFWLDAFEATGEELAGHPVPDGLRAANRVTRAEAAAYCAHEGGRLPTEDEWIAAAAGLGAHRYPWGETGAVCRRAAFGLAQGPCSSLGTGPDTVGAHTDGDSTHGIHDLAGNVAEWVLVPGEPSRGVAKGGSWRSELATELRVWAKLELDPAMRDDRVGVRCAYDAP